ncbi:MAG: histidine phosphatase family protein [Dehalococcoidia bacterium]
MTLLLVRHGQSAGNASRIIQGQWDAPLTDLGRHQAEVVAERLASAGASTLYTSSLERTRDTAAPIARSTRLEARPLDEWREYCWGDAQGRTWTEALELWGRGDPPTLEWGNNQVPGEEGEAVFGARIAEAFTTLLERHVEDTAIVVTHGGVIIEVVRHVFGIQGYRPVSTPTNTSVSTFTLERGVAVIAAYNDASHLRPLEATAPPPA